MTVRTHVAMACALLAYGLFLLPSLAQAADVELLIRNHRFEPETLTIAAGKRVRIIVHNQDVTPEEFESYELNREKVIPGKTTAYIYIGPLAPGSYPFFGEFHQATARGRIIVK